MGGRGRRRRSEKRRGSGGCELRDRQRMFGGPLSVCFVWCCVVHKPWVVPQLPAVHHSTTCATLHVIMLVTLWFVCETGAFGQRLLLCRVWPILSAFAYFNYSYTDTPHTPLSAGVSGGEVGVSVRYLILLSAAGSKQDMYPAHTFGALPPAVW